MIRYALRCIGDHEFEAWFSDSEAYTKQRKRGLVECPECGSKKIEKQLMAPAVRSSRSAEASAAKQEAAFARMAGEVRKHVAETHEFVGDRFADEARAMHYGETEGRPVWGQVNLETAKELYEEGVPAMPLPEPFAPKPPKSRKKLN